MPTMRQRLAKALMTQVPVPQGWSRATAPLGGGATDSKNAPIFANYKAVTFPGLVGFVGAIWLGLEQTGAGWTASRWVPLAICLLFGGSLTCLELSEDNVTPPARKFWGGLVGLGNCFVLFSAVIGSTHLLIAPRIDRPDQQKTNAVLSAAPALGPEVLVNGQ